MKREIITDIRFIKQNSFYVMDTTDAQQILDDLEDSIPISGVGLSAIQIGIPKRIAIIRTSNFNLNLFNPEIVEKYDPIRSRNEGCLSLPGIRIDTKRYNEIHITNDGEKIILTGIEAIIVQHEIDHMNGLTILDRRWRKR